MANRGKAGAHLHSVKPGKPERAERQEKEPSAVGDLLSGRVARSPRPSRRRKADLPPQPLPGEIEPISNLFAAARTLKRDIETKEGWAKGRLDEYCLKDFVHRAALTDRRPSSMDYSSSHSKFKFVLTARTTLTPDKEDALAELGLDLKEHTVLTGIEVNYDAIRQHGLESKLRQALEAMNVGKGVLDECFRPKVELKDTFYDRLTEIVKRSLRQGESLEVKMLEVLHILQPTQQVRNVDVIGMSNQQCYDLVMHSEIEPEEEIA